MKEIQAFLSEKLLFDRKAYLTGSASKGNAPQFEVHCVDGLTEICITKGAIKCLTRLAEMGLVQTKVDGSCFNLILCYERSFLALVRKLKITLLKIIPFPTNRSILSVNDDTVRYCLEEGLTIDKDIFQH